MSIWTIDGEAVRPQHGGLAQPLARTPEEQHLSEIHLLEHAPQHRWHYFSNMAMRKVLVFKQYDSQASGVSRFTPHAAFLDLATPVDAPLRASIGTRCLALFD